MERILSQRFRFAESCKKENAFEGKGPKMAPCGEKIPQFNKQRRASSGFQNFEFEFEFSNLEVLEFVMKSFSFLLSVLVYVL